MPSSMFIWYARVKLIWYARVSIFLVCLVVPICYARWSLFVMLGWIYIVMPLRMFFVMPPRMLFVMPLPTFYGMPGEPCMLCWAGSYMICPVIVSRVLWFTDPECVILLQAFLKLNHQGTWGMTGTMCWRSEVLSMCGSQCLTEVSTWYPGSC